MAFSETASYIWNTETDLLGKGSFGKVFRGIHKETGEAVAVKIFTKSHPDNAKEMEMLRGLRHRYIIQLLSVERESQSGKRVLIIELCNGGSLLQFLNEPENVHGLVDEEFLLVLRHLTEGVKYLKKLDVIHRDVKPGNIMRHVQADGQVVYKLADFGAARELPEGENFESIHGTELYLHPNLYRVCLGDSRTNRHFDGTTDLWSIGVTMYHIASNQLPFRCRSSHLLKAYEEMKRSEGFISAVQETHAPFRINYNRSLPPSARLSSGLQPLVTSIIAGLFVFDNPTKQWSFQRYAEKADDLLSRRAIRVLHIDTMRVLKIYLKPEEGFDVLRDCVFTQTGIDKANQGYFYKRKLVVTKNCPETITDFLYLFNRSTNVISTIAWQAERWPNLADFKARFVGSSEDLLHAKNALNEVGSSKVLLENQSVVYSGILDFARDFSEYFQDELKKQRKLHNYLVEKCDGVRRRMGMLKRIAGTVPRDLGEDLEAIAESFVPRTSQLFNNLKGVDSGIQLVDICYHSYLKTIGKELASMVVLYENLKRDRGNKQYYQIEKIQFIHCVGTVWSILKDKVKPQFGEFLNQVGHWYEEVFFQHLKSLHLLKEHQCQYMKTIKKIEKEVQAQLDEKLDEMGHAQPRSTVNKQLRSDFQQYRSSREETELLLAENDDLMRKIKLLLQEIC